MARLVLPTELIAISTGRGLLSRYKQDRGVSLIRDQAGIWSLQTYPNIETASAYYIGGHLYDVLDSVILNELTAQGFGSLLLFGPGYGMGPYGLGGFGSVGTSGGGGTVTTGPTDVYNAGTYGDGVYGA